MKNLLQNTLVVLAFGLCALCAWQWYVQTRLYTQGAVLQNTLHKYESEIQGYTNSIKNMDTEISGLSTRVNELTAGAKTNEQFAFQQKREIIRLHATSEMLSNAISQYKDVVDQLEAKLKEAGDGIEKQNDAIKKLVVERDNAIQKINDTMKDRNDLAEKYNTLVDRFKKLQADTSGTNTAK